MIADERNSSLESCSLAPSARCRFRTPQTQKSEGKNVSFPDDGHSRLWHLGAGYICQAGMVAARPSPDELSHPPWRVSAGFFDALIGLHAASILLGAATGVQGVARPSRSTIRRAPSSLGSSCEVRPINASWTLADRLRWSPSVMLASLQMNTSRKQV
jgi:hypothetical protein